MKLRHALSAILAAAMTFSVWGISPAQAMPSSETSALNSAESGLIQVGYYKGRHYRSHYRRCWYVIRYRYDRYGHRHKYRALRCRRH
jgi:hypothetical protein